jgi:glycosyltransferase involved in cell wall biosynthesis
VVLFLGRVTPVKGPDLLLRAAAKLLARGRRCVVRIVGSSNFSTSDPLTPYERELRRLAEPLGSAVEFHPFVDRAAVVGEYQRASVFCAPANWDEPFGMTLMEAMACGLAVVTSRRGGIPEACGDAALYFDTPDVDSLADRLGQLLDSAEDREAWGRRARRRADQFDWPRQYAALTRLLES